MRCQPTQHYRNGSAIVSVDRSDCTESLEVIEVYLAGAGKLHPRQRDRSLQGRANGRRVVTDRTTRLAHPENIVVPSEVRDLNGRQDNPRCTLGYRLAGGWGLATHRSRGAAQNESDAGRDASSSHE